MEVTARKAVTNLLVIGVHKAGTTALYNYLSKHPQVCSPLVKELHFFTPLIYGGTVGDLDAYFRNFNYKKNHKYVLDVSPSYFYGPDCIGDALEQMCERKLVLLLREPVERFVSFYKQCVKTGRISKQESISEFFTRSLDAYHEYLQTGVAKNNVYCRAIREGCYARYLQRWLERYGDSLYVMYHDELLKNPKEQMSKLTAWLEIADFSPDMRFDRENEAFTTRFRWLSRLATTIFRRYEAFFRTHRTITSTIKRAYLFFNKSNLPTPVGDALPQIVAFYSETKRAIKQCPAKVRKESASMDQGASDRHELNALRQ